MGIAHRGYSPAGAENSLAAFEAAVALGFDHLETDARVTADGVAVAFHDDRLDRVTNSTGRLAELTWAQVSRARILGAEPIPRLEEVLEAFPGVHVNIDVKSDAAIGPTLDVLRHTGAQDRVRLAAFSHRRLLTLRNAAGPSVATALSPREIADIALHRRGFGRPARQAAASPGVDAPFAAQVPAGPSWARLVDRAFVHACHHRGIAVHVWTINTVPDMIRLIDLGVDAIMTDRADVLAGVLRERDAWH